MNYLIAGFSGAGKTYLLEQIKMQEAFSSFDKFDLDHEVARFLSIEPSVLGAWIRENGMERFRRNEAEVLERLLRGDQQIIALGGGSYTEDLHKMLLQKKEVAAFHLDTPFATCWERIRNDQNRPLVAVGEEELEKIYRKRRALLSSLPKISGIHDFTRLISLSE